MPAKRRLPILDPSSPAWRTRDDMAALLGYSTRQIDYLRERFDFAFEDRQRNLVFIYTPPWMQLWRDYFIVHGRDDEA